MYHLLRDHNDHGLKTSDKGLILKLLSLSDKHSDEFFDVYYTMIFHNIKHYFLMTLRNLDINVMKLIFKLSSTHSLIMFPTYEPHGGASAQYSNNLYKNDSKIYQSTVETSRKIMQRIRGYTEQQWEAYFLSGERQVETERKKFKQTRTWRFFKVYFILFFIIKCPFLDQEPCLFFEPLLSAWRIALFSDSKVNINLHKGYILGKASAEQNKLNFTVIRKHSKYTVTKCDFFSGLQKKAHEQCTTKPVLTAMLDSKSNEWELDHKAGFGFSSVMTLLYTW